MHGGARRTAARLAWVVVKPLISPAVSPLNTAPALKTFLVGRCLIYLGRQGEAGDGVASAVRSPTPCAPTVTACTLLSLGETRGCSHKQGRGGRMAHG
jgi:hypothetical protein